ncbi:MAG: phosphoribosylamine--glycine ligase [Hyphomicrobiaceae bacterium]
MNVLLIGGGGREHALGWALSKSSQINTLYAAPGNAGMKDIAAFPDLNTTDHKAVVDFCRDKAISLVVVGPEAPLVAGLSDDLRAANINVFGPSKAAAQLEGSKNFTKALCDEFNIPTAAYGHFDNAADAKAYIEKQGAPIVIKADGLAAGKGVIMARTLNEAMAGIDRCFEGAFGAAGAEVVIEEWLEGEEASFFVLSDGKTIVPFGTAQDHKRVGDGDTGPNTGGMGAYSPAPVLSSELVQQTLDEIIAPTIAGMAQRGTPYQGVLYAGLMITKDGPKLIEYNVRFGDPECQVLMMRLKSNLLDALYAAATGSLENVTPEWHGDAALTVVMAAKGYPGAVEKGSEIKGLEVASDGDGVEIFHAGTKRENGAIVAAGGRVLNITSSGGSVGEAQKHAYAAISKIDWPEGFCRTDIGYRAIARENGKAL